MQRPEDGFISLGVHLQNGLDVVPDPSAVWLLDEVYTKINSEMAYLWRAVDDDGTALDVVAQHRRNTQATLRLLQKPLKIRGTKPTKIVTNRLGSHLAALKRLALKHLQDVGGRKNKPAECSHVPIRERAGIC